MNSTDQKSQTTRERIERAIREMHEAGCKMTISGVAKEAGISNASIHNRYPDLASQIRKLPYQTTASDGKNKLQKNNGSIKTAKQQIQALRQALIDSKKKVADLFSVNYSLDMENQSLRAENEALKCQQAEALNIRRLCNNNGQKCL